jgi:hypothetical protein
MMLMLYGPELSGRYSEEQQKLTFTTVKKIDASRVSEPGNPTAINVPPHRKYSIACA